MANLLQGSIIPCEKKSNNHYIGDGFNPVVKYARQVGSFPIISPGIGINIQKKWKWNHHVATFLDL